MKKLALDVTQLKVQSFELQETSQLRGTVNAHETRGPCTPGCSVNVSCNFTCEYTCETGICFC